MTGRPSIRGRLTLIAAAAVTVVAVAVGALAWLALQQTLVEQVDRELRGMTHGPLGDLSPRAAARIPETPLDVQRELRMQVRFEGTAVAAPPDTPPLPWSAVDEAVAAGARSEARYTVDTADGRFRILTFRGSQGQAIQLARSLTGPDATLQRLGVLIAALAVGAAALAALAGRVVARAGLRPVDRLTAAATRVAETRDLSEPIPVDGHDEIAQLGQAFNHMLSRLGQAQRQQRELIEDAAHELRTPMASMRTNVELLIHAGRKLGDDDRTALLGDLDRQSVELAELVTNLVDLARSRTVDEPLTEVDVAEVANAAISLAEAHFPGTAFRLDAPAPVTLGARPAALQRALVNLLDNAAKFGPAGQTVEVHIGRRGRAVEISVLDRCPTIPADHRERVFQRFHRLDSSRSVPGSGLGLAIVQQTVAAHGGTATVSARPGGGNLFRLSMPANPAG
jgi:two-component system, OmpR family, sensor histidine kinase MprB